MLMMNLCGQRVVDQFYIGRNVPDLQLSRIINYKDSTAKLSSFGEKLIILDFWSIHCGPCVAAFPKMDSIQKELGDKVQFILVTYDSKNKVIPFLKKWNTDHKTILSIPIICGETALIQLFAHHGNPHMAFIQPNGNLLLQACGKDLLNKVLINSIATKSIDLINRMKTDGFPESAYKMKPPNQVLKKRLNQNKYIEMKFIY